MKNFVEEFNKNYSAILREYYANPNITQLSFSSICGLFDAVIADITEGKNISEFFEKTGIDKNDFISWRYKVIAMNFRDYLFGDDNNEVILFYNTPIMKQILGHMQRRIEEDINGEPNLKNVSDYSRPKMVMISGHDTTISAQEMFFIRFFGLDLDSYQFPTYSSQMTCEITRVDDDKFNREKKFSDYKVRYYLNNKLILSIPFDEFKEKVEKVVWNQEQMDNYCFGKKEENLEIGLILVIIMGIVILILIIIIIILLTKIAKGKEDSLNTEKLINNDKIINDD